MITIPVDEAYAYDYLSILELKKDKDPTSPTKKKTFDEVFAHLRETLGALHYEVWGSLEYEKLYAANKETFEMVDLAKTDSVSASVVDRANYKRFVCKKALQKRFFDSPVSEEKIGYEKYES